MSGAATGLALASAGKGMVVRVTLDGQIKPKPVATGLICPFRIDVAPAGFGNLKDQIFVTDAGNIQIPVPGTQALKHDGKIFRTTPSGELRLVAANLRLPLVAQL